MAIVVTALPACKGTKKGNADDFGGGVYGEGGFGEGSSDGSLPSRDEGYSYYGSGSNGVLKGQFAPVYFEFDSPSVSNSEMSKVRDVANSMRGGSSKVLVAGFADAVGTEEYNRGLGDRRALSVRSSLISMGVSSSRIQTVSFGEEMLADPSNPGSGSNRRVEFGIVK
jgi:peptidoglycan-associated lipoprotein